MERNSYLLRERRTRDEANRARHPDAPQLDKGQGSNCDRRGDGVNHQGPSIKGNEDRFLNQEESVELFQEIGFNQEVSNSGQGSNLNQAASDNNNHRSGSPILVEDIQKIHESQDKLRSVFNEHYDLLNKIAKK